MGKAHSPDARIAPVATLCKTGRQEVTRVASVPFSVPNLHGGLATARGIVRLEPEHLVLEFDVKDDLVGVFNSGVSRVRIPLTEVESLKLSKRLWWTTFIVRTRSMTAIADVPGRSHEGFRLSIARKYRDDAAELTAEVDLRMAELRLDEMDRET